MTRELFARLAAIVAATGLCVAATAAADDDWYPSRHGPDDRIGAANYLSADIVKRAADLVTTGTAPQARASATA